MVTTYIAGSEASETAKWAWGGPENDSAVARDDLRLFLFHLEKDQQFAGYDNQQLLRYSLAPPVAIAAALTIIWMTQGLTWSKVILLALVVGFVLLLVLDHFRLRSLLIHRWKSLADDYPTWLPEAALDRRNRGQERIREVLHGDAGIRSVRTHQKAHATEPEDDRDRRVGFLRATSTQVRLSGAPQLADALDRIVESGEASSSDYDVFYGLAASWSGSRIEDRSGT